MASITHFTAVMMIMIALSPAWAQCRQEQTRPEHTRAQEKPREATLLSHICGQGRLGGSGDLGTQSWRLLRGSLGSCEFLWLRSRTEES